MNEVKRWARRYLKDSPIFGSRAFSQPYNEKIMQINPQLLAAYALNMYQLQHYQHQQTLSLLDSFPALSAHDNLRVARAMLEEGVQAEGSEQKGRFRELQSRLFKRVISREEFRELGALYVQLKGSDQVGEFDDVVLDLSFFEVWQLGVFAGLGLQLAAETIGRQALQLLERKAEQGGGDYFSFVRVLQRISDRL
jgi:hypothetical protein